ncbi:MAG: hypothetical protein C4522_19225 [Desulfobacteraceae bacterium]|nr:MAG: hypothetical protein C4522_19225 [Desulfobacteraceae bacterium]
MKKKSIIFIVPACIFLLCAIAFAAYHHEGESDAANFLAAYPGMAGSKLDHCALCHTGGQYEQKPGVYESLGSCQWCHYSYGYDGSGNIVDTLNQYGIAYFANGRNAAAISAIDTLDSDGDGYTNKTEIEAERFPGDGNDDPGKTQAPYRVYTRSELEAMAPHTQFLLMNTARSGDFYAEYTGVPMETLLTNAGILDSATGITVYAPDGWSNYHPLTESEDPEFYHVNGTYPQSLFYKADDSGEWCDYSAPSCVGRNNNDPIVNTNGLKMILAYKREGVAMDKGILTSENKLDGEGPFRVVVPQKNPGPPDQSSKSSNQSVTWPYNYDWDHNAGSCSRSATIIRVEPLPEGTTDINVLEAGWNYVDEEKVIIYGAISESNVPASNTDTTAAADDDDDSTCFIRSLY